MDLNKIGHNEESFILASQAKQVLYIQDPSDSRWSIVLASQPKFIGDDEDDDDDDYDIGELQTFEKEIGEINEFEGIESIVGPYVRRDCDGIWIVSLYLKYIFIFFYHWILCLCLWTKSFNIFYVLIFIFVFS